MDNDFRDELSKLLNKHSKENGSNTPDFILADLLAKQLALFDQTMERRETWFGRPVPANHNPFTNKEIASGR